MELKIATLKGLFLPLKFESLPFYFCLVFLIGFLYLVWLSIRYCVTLLCYLHLCINVGEWWWFGLFSFLFFFLPSDMGKIKAVNLLNSPLCLICLTCLDVVYYPVLSVCQCNYLHPPAVCYFPVIVPRYYPTWPPLCLRYGNLFCHGLRHMGFYLFFLSDSEKIFDKANNSVHLDLF